MRRRRGQHGFTVLETLIFLAVSTALFVTSVGLITDQQNKVEFSFGIQELTSELRDAVNDVSTGYYKRDGDFRCRKNPGNGKIQILPPGADGEQGTNKDCIFIGRVVQFSPSPISTGFNTDQVYRIYTVIGVRTETENGLEVEVNTIQDARPTILDAASETGSPSFSEKIIPNGIQIKRAVNGSGGNAAAFGFLTNFVEYSDNAVIESSPRNTSFAALAVNFNSSPANVNAQVEALTKAAVEANDSVSLCFEFKGYKSTITLGGNLNDVSTENRIERGTC
jgi:hypothetical protein